MSGHPFIKMLRRRVQNRRATSNHVALFGNDAFKTVTFSLDEAEALFEVIDDLERRLEAAETDHE